jgi:general secretion pathway protein J
MRPGRGFTLVELLVALALMAVLAGLAWQGLAGVADAKRTSDERVNATLRIGTVLAQWEQDLNQVHDTQVVPALAFDGATLRLVRRQPDGVQVVAWSLRDGRWQRWASAVTVRAPALQDAWLASQQLLGNEPNQLTLLDGVSGWQIYFYRGNAWSNAQSSADVAPAAPPPPVAGAASAPVPRAPARQLLPTGVRLVLTLQGGADPAAAPKLTRDILLAPQLP